MIELNLMSELNLSFTTINEQELHDNFDAIFKKVQNGITFAIVSKGKVLCYLQPHVPKTQGKKTTKKASTKKGNAKTNLEK
ncbi:MAG: hypothetical protein AB1554_13060 [Chloroflexota bacterium]